MSMGVVIVHYLAFSKPNASLQLLPEAEAKRKLYAVSCKALFGLVPRFRHFAEGIDR